MQGTMGEAFFLRGTEIDYDDYGGVSNGIEWQGEESVVVGRWGSGNFSYLGAYGNA